MEQKKRRQRIRKWSVGGMVALAGFMLTGIESQAGVVELGKGFSLDYDIFVSYGGAFRVKDPAGPILADLNADDGDRNYEKNSLVINRFNTSAAVDLSYNDQYGIFVRPRAYYDFANMGSNDNDSPLTHNNAIMNGGSLTDTSKFSDTHEDLHGKKAEFLDYYFYGENAMGDAIVAYKIGSQVVSWGESLFSLAGIASSQTPIDGTSASAPGVEAKDIFLPEEQIDVKLGAGDWSFEGYYQWAWTAHRLGSPQFYFTGGDVLLEGAESLLLAPGFYIPRVANVNAKDDGQWGVQTTYLASWLADTELSLFYLNYHRRLPVDELTPVTDPNVVAPYNNLGYRFVYQEDIGAVGGSFSAVLGETNVSGEFSVRQDMWIPNQLGGYDEQDVGVGLVSIMHIFGPSWLADNTQILAEAGGVKVFDVSTADVKEGKDDWAYGVKVKANLDYFQVMQGVDLRFWASYRNDFHSSPMPMTYTDKRREVSTGLDFTINKVMLAQISYTDFLGDEDDGLAATYDRDYIGFNLQYSF
jgi:hypothetical protein